MADVPIVCTLTSPEERARQTQAIAALVRCASSREVSDSGVLLRFEARDGLLARLAQILEVERVCCSFLQFTVAIAPAVEGITLEISGPSDARSAVEQIWSLTPGL